MPDLAPVDHVRKALLDRAASCLDHVRTVKWGEATASYTVVDGDRSLDILVRVTCARKAEP